MKIVFLGGYDWANTSNRIARAINRCSGPMTARVVTKYPHPFGYPEDVVIQRDGHSMAVDAAKDADWIVGSGDANYELWDELLDQYGNSDACLGIRHSGTELRNNPRKCNAEDLARGFRRRFVPLDLYGDHKEDDSVRVFVQPQGDFSGRSPVYTGGAMRFVHTPSERRTKGTKYLVQAMNKLVASDPRRFEFHFVEKVTFCEAFEQRKKHHVYIDHMSELGNFGAGTCEAMACGMPVIARSNEHVMVDNPWIQWPPISWFGSNRMLAYKCNLMLEEYAELAKKSKDWSVRYLSDKYTYLYWEQCLSS